MQRTAWSLLGAVALACGGNGTKTTGAIGPTGDVALEIVGFVNQRGEHYEREDSPVVLSCDTTVSVQFGPPDGAGALNNWLLRPPGTCESYAQCGYINLSATPQDGGAKVVVNGATVTQELEASPGDYLLNARLIGPDGMDFLQDEQPVRDSLEVRFASAENCEPQSSGSGGTSSGGTSSSSGGGGGSGGEGMGGAAGAAGEAGMSGAAGAE